MFKLVLISVLIAIVAAKPKPKPSGLYGAPLAQEVAVAPVKTVAYADQPIDDGFSAEVINSAYEPVSAVVSNTYVPEAARVEVREPVVASAGHVVHGVPTSVSHRSTTTVHSKANYLGSVAAPGVQTYSAPIEKYYSAPVVASAGPVVASAAYTAAPIAATRFAAAVPYTGAVVKSYAAGPVFNSYATPYGYGAAYPYATGGQVYRTYAAPSYYSAGPVVKSYVSSPLSYSAPFNQVYAK